MANALSRLHSSLETWSFKYNCYEAVHPWTPFCSDSALDLGLTVFGEAIKLYTPLYLFSQLMQRKFDRDSFIITSQSILRSTAFISSNAFFALLFFCTSKYVTGKFYYYAVAYVPGFLASSMAVMIEKPSRRSSLAFYVANVASEALYRIYVARGYIRPVKHGQVYLFTLSIATIMLLAKQNGFDDDPLSAAIRLIVGPEEAGRRRSRRRLEAPNDTGAAGQPLEPQTGRLDEPGWPMLGRHRLCPHPDRSCALYVVSASARALLIGCGAQLALRLASRAPALWRQPEKLLELMLTDRQPLRVGLFLATFAGLYKATNCLLRHSLDTGRPAGCFIAGLVAGSSMLLYPSPTVALYVTWKCLESLFHEAVRRGLIRNQNAFIVILYGLATAQLFYSAMMDPKYMKQSYMAFLDRISHHRLHMVNRSVLDVFGTEASAGYEDFFPDLHPKFMSSAFIGSIWIWMIEQKFVVAKQLSK